MFTSGIVIPLGNTLFLMRILCLICVMIYRNITLV